MGLRKIPKFPKFFERFLEALWELFGSWLSFSKLFGSFTRAVRETATLFQVPEPLHGGKLGLGICPSPTAQTYS